MRRDGGSREGGKREDGGGKGGKGKDVRERRDDEGGRGGNKEKVRGRREGEGGGRASIRFYRLRLHLLIQLADCQTSLLSSTLVYNQYTGQFIGR